MKMLIALAAGALGWCYYRGHELRSRKEILKEDVTRWEGEGGNVPAVATPSPAPTPASSVPPGAPAH
jgi:hypothetical protein